MYEGEDGVIIKAVYTIDGSQEFTGIDIQEYMRKLENPDSKYDKGKYFFYNNGYLYFPKETSIRMVMVKALFIDQIVNKCEKGTHEECLPAYEWRVRIPKKLLGEIMSHVDQDFLPYKQIREDEKIDKNQTI